MSSFLAFSNERRRAIAEANPNMNGTELSILLAKLWKDCPADVKQSYRDREMREREVYKRHRAEWERQQDMLLTLQVIGPDPAAVFPTDANEVSTDSSAAGIPAQHEQLQIGEQIPSHLIPLLPPLKGNEGQDTQTSVFSSLLAQNSQNPFGGLLPASSSQCLEAATVGAPSFPSPSNEDRFIHPMGNCNLAPHPSRFEHYSLDDIMQDDELFEDFSPGDVPPIPRNCSSQNSWDGTFH